MSLMSPASLVMLAAIVFLASVVGVVTGGTSLITVPAMIWLGVEPHIAIATNMMALIFMSIGGSLPFVQSGAFHRKYLPMLLTLTVLGSALGAMVLLSISARLLKLSVAIAMIAISVLVMWKRDMGTDSERKQPSSAAVFVGYLATFLLAVYGGFFSGGYVTMLTAAFVVFFGMTFHQSVAVTKVANIFSSVVATSVFLWHGIVDVRLGLVLGLMMFVGAVLGSYIALRMNAVLLRRIFIIAVLALALKMIMALHS